jgi:type II secretory pathway component GspD/PulD (secretin)
LLLTVGLVSLLLGFCTPAPAQEEGEAVEALDTGTSPTARKFNAEGEPLTTLVFSGNQKIDLILLKIKKDTGETVQAVGKAQGATIPGPLLTDVTVKEALEYLAGVQPDWVWWYDATSGIYKVGDRQTYEEEVLKQQVVQRIIRPQNIPAAEARAAVEQMITPNIGNITHDERTNQVIVTDLLPVVEAIERTIRLLDQKVFTRVFEIKNADPDLVMQFLEEYKSPPGKLVLQPRMRQIIAVDTFENIQRMEVIVSILDRGPELRVYDLNNIDFEGQRLADLEALLTEEIITEGAYLRFDLESSRLILMDLPSVHEKVEQILKAVDQPARQVYIQADVVNAQYRHSIDYGTEWTFADDRLIANATGGTDGTGTDGTGGTGGTGGTVPVTGGGVTVQPAQDGDLGFQDLDAAAGRAAKILNAAYPIVSGGGSGITLDYLSRHARINFNAVMSDEETHLLAQPRLLVKNRGSADIVDGGTLPYVTTTYYGGGYGGYQPGYGGYTPSIGYGSVPTGVTLQVDPLIMNNGLIEMLITLENVAGNLITVTANSQSNQVPETRNQSIRTTLVMPDGQTRMIGGLIENRDTESIAGIPYLKDIPIIGPLAFGNRSYEPTRRTLMMFITATILQEKAREYAEEPDDDYRTPPVFLEEVEWGQGAVDRAAEAARAEVEQQFPGFFETMPETEGFEPFAAEGTERTGRPMSSDVMLSHTETTGPMRSRQPRALMTPRSSSPGATPEPVEPAEGTGPPPGELIVPTPEMPPPPGNMLPAVPPELTPLVPEESLPPVEEAPGNEPAEGQPTTGTEAAPQPEAMMFPDTGPTTYQLAAAFPPPLTRGGRPIGPADLPIPPDVELTLPRRFPTTGSVVVSETTPRIVLGSRRPSEVKPPSLRREVRPTPTPAEGIEGQAPSASSYQVIVVGEEGQAIGAYPTGEMAERRALGTVRIPIKTLTTVKKATPARRTPVRRTPARATPPRRTPVRPTPAATVGQPTQPIRPQRTPAPTPRRTPRGYRPGLPTRAASPFGGPVPVQPGIRRYR